MQEAHGLPNTDLLLDALVILTRLHQRPFSAESLAAGLPLENGMLTPELFVRAAERAGFSAASLQRSLPDINDLVLPVALILKDGNCAVLQARTSESATVIFADEPDLVHNISLDALGERYSGHCLYVKPEYSAAEDEDSPNEHWFWSTLRKSRGLYTEVLVASLLVNLFALVTPLFIMNVYDRVVPNHAVETLWVLASGVALVFFFDLLMKSLRGYFIDTAGKRADILLSAKTFSKVMNIKMSERPSRVGSFASNLHEFDTFREFFTSTTMITLIDLPFVILFVLLIWGIGGIELALVPMLAIPIIVTIGVLFQKPLQSVVNQIFAESSRKQAMLIETLTALDTVKGVRGEGVMQRRWEVFNAQLARLGLRSRFLSLSAINSAQVVTQLGTVAVVILGVYAIIDARLSVGGLIACTILTGRCLAPMAQVASILTRYHHSIAAFHAIDRVMNLSVERPEGKKFLHRPSIAGDIEFRSVSFSYPDQTIAAINGLSFKISAGEKVAILGKTGSGKSTLQRLVMQFYEPSDGSILVNGTDIKQIDPNDLRASISYVPQETILFNGSVRDNIVLGAPLSTDEEVLNAANLSGISDYLNQHPEGYDLAVGERGHNLSGGQRQGIAISRALLNHGNVILLDEPTNAMDNATELAFIQRLKSHIADKTLLLVTHKQSMLSLVDRLLVLNDGQLVADGPREEVLKLLAGGGN